MTNVSVVQLNCSDHSEKISAVKTLIVVYSLTGNNDTLAGYLKSRIACDLSRLQTIRKSNGFSIFLDVLFNRRPSLKAIEHDIRRYDHVIFMAPIWAGKIANPLNSFLLRNASGINNYSFVTVCGGGNSSQKDKVSMQLAAIVGRAPVNVLELWTKKVVDVRGAVGKTTASLRIKMNDLNLFNKELDGFVDKF